jgi:NADP+-dependent farnesol dehydrogenase
VSPGVVETDFFAAAKIVAKGVSITSVLPALDSSDISNAVLYLLSTPYHVNITEMTVRPVGESF